MTIHLAAWFLQVLMSKLKTRKLSFRQEIVGRIGYNSHNLPAHKDLCVCKYYLSGKQNYSYILHRFGYGFRDNSSCSHNLYNVCHIQYFHNNNSIHNVSQRICNLRTLCRWAGNDKRNDNINKVTAFINAIKILS